MSFVSSLFSFSKKEVADSFSRARRRAKEHGIILLQGPLNPAFNHEQGKLLIIIPGKTGNATKRNKIRRQLKSIFYQEKLYQVPIITIALIYKPALKVPFATLRTFLTEKITHEQSR